MKNDGIAEMKNVFYLHPDGIILHSLFFIFHTSFVQSFVAVLDFIDREQNCNDFYVFYF